MTDEPRTGSSEPAADPGHFTAGRAAHVTTPADTDGDGERPARSGRNEDSLGAFLRELPILVLIAFVLAFLLRTFVVQVFYIPSSSMEPTLQVNDRILVDKLTYRLRDIRHGEIVVFEGDQLGVPESDAGPVQRVVRGFGQLVGLAPANARDFVKRVVGLPGDEISIQEGVVSVNGVPIDEPYAVDDPRSCEPIVVPDGKLFFLGDNRPNSSDSRYASLGFVDVDHVVGKAFTVIWPVEDARFLRSPTYHDQIPEPDQPAPAPADTPGGPCTG